jgi:hypothetical protein
MPTKTAISKLLEMYLRGTTLDEKIMYLKRFAETGSAEHFFDINIERQAAMPRLIKLTANLDKNAAKAISARLLQRFVEQAADQQQPREETKVVLLKFEDDGTALLASDLSEYLRLLDGFYHRDFSSHKTAPKTIKRKLPLTIERIQKRSPLEIWFTADITALVVAIIIVGGKLSVSFVGTEVEIQIGTLGEELKSLMGALAPARTKPRKSDKSKSGKK